MNTKKSTDIEKEKYIPSGLLVFGLGLIQQAIFRMFIKSSKTVFFTCPTASGIKSIQNRWGRELYKSQFTLRNWFLSPNETMLSVRVQEHQSNYEQWE